MRRSKAALIVALALGLIAAALAAEAEQPAVAHMPCDGGREKDGRTG